jgi:hypothetical protein
MSEFCCLERKTTSSKVKFKFATTEISNMHTEARKLHIIEVVLKTQSDAVLEALEMIVDSNLIAPGKSATPNFSELLGVLTPAEAEAMKKSIDENFEKINSP